jgi:hypothetical protein
MLELAGEVVGELLKEVAGGVIEVGRVDNNDDDIGNEVFVNSFLLVDEKLCGDEDNNETEILCGDKDNNDTEIFVEGGIDGFLLAESRNDEDNDNINEGDDSDEDDGDSDASDAELVIKEGMDDSSLPNEKLCNDEELRSTEGPGNGEDKVLFKAGMSALDDETSCPDQSFSILSSSISFGYGH